VTNRPLSNGKALAITVGAAAFFFGLLLFIPSPRSRPPQVSSDGGTANPVTAKESPESLFKSRCVQCHALPALTHRTPEDWRILVLKMNRYMKQTGRRSLSDTETREVTHYIVSNQR
jgi:hypothetical protein